MKREKILSFIMAAVIPFPLLLTGLASTYETIPTFIIVGGIIGGAICWFLGQILGIFLKKANKKLIYAVRSSSVLLGVGIAVLSEIVIFSMKMGSLAPIFIPVAYIFWYWFGFRAGGEQALISPIILGAYGVEAVFMYPICNSFNQKASFPIIIITAFVTVLGALLTNFRQISGLSLRGKSENKLLTKSCTRFNLKATLIFCGIVLFAFFFCGVGAKWLWEGIKTFFRYIIYLMSLLSTLLSQDEYDPEDISDPSIIQITENSGGKYLIYVIAVILAIIFFKPFVKAIKNFYRYIMEKLGRGTEKTVQLQYTDIYQESGTKRTAKNTFKKAYRAFLREKDNKTKFRLGYKAFLIRLREKEVELAPPDTPTDHYEKGRTVTESESLSAVTDKYCKVRYDDNIPTKEDCEVMRELLTELK